MAAVVTRSLGQITAAFQAAAQNAAALVGNLLDFSTGSVSLALAEAGGSVALWLQKITLQVMGLTRFATSYGTDADSWGAQFGFPRLPATAATGSVTFYPAVSPATSQLLIPASATPTNSTQVQTASGSQVFAVTIDTSNAAWNATLGGYVINIGSTSVTVPVQALVAGTAGNVQSGLVTSIVGAVSGISPTVTNSAAFVNGDNAESDTAYKARFPLFLQGLESADTAAIESAIMGVQQGITYALAENLDYPGTTTDDGSFFVVINDGSGSPPSTLLSAVAAAVNAERAFGVRFQGAYAPTLITPTISMAIRIASGFTTSVVEGQVQAAVVLAVNSTPLNQGTLFVSQINAAALSVPGVVAVQPGGTTINGVAADLVFSNITILPQISVSNVTVGTY